MYQNMKAFDAGTINMPGSGAPMGTPTFDAAGVAAGGAFLISGSSYQRAS